MNTKYRALSLLACCLGPMAMLSAQAALAANAETGKRLALTRCLPCHAVAPNQREELANAPTFASVARNAGFSAEAVLHAILSPHPHMNMTVRPDEADDIAAYIATLR